MVIRVVEGAGRDGSHEVGENRYVHSRELTMLAMYANGITIEEAAKKLGVSPHTVKNHLFNIGKKLRAKNRSHAIVTALGKGMLEVVKLEREEAFAGERRSDYVWCLHCERTYQYWEFREVKAEKFMVDHVEYDPVYQMCPYEDCDGDAVLDAWDWSEVREGHGDYPEIPEPAEAYPLYT